MNSSPIYLSFNDLTNHFQLTSEDILKYFSLFNIYSTKSLPSIFALSEGLVSKSNQSDEYKFHKNIINYLTKNIEKEENKIIQNIIKNMNTLNYYIETIIDNVQLDQNTNRKFIFQQYGNSFIEGDINRDYLPYKNNLKFMKKLIHEIEKNNRIDIISRFTELNIIYNKIKLDKTLDLKNEIKINEKLGKI